jgi:hypothetical protein
LSWNLAPRLCQFASVFAASHYPGVGRLHLVRTVLYVARRKRLLLSRRSLQDESASPGNATRECRQIAFDHQKSLDLHLDLPVIALATIDLPVRAMQLLERWHSARPVEPSPPDLQVLNSTFLI